MGKRPKTKIIGVYGGIFLLVISFLSLSYGNDRATQKADSVSASQSANVAATSASQEKVSVDKLKRANAATDLAEMMNLPVAGSLREEVTTLYIKKELSQSDVEVINKPQIIQPDAATKRGIITHKVVEGESLASIAQQHGVSAQTLRWANSTTSDAVEVGKEVVVPLVDGIVYTVREGDTVAGIASKYKADAERVVLYNDLETGVEPVQGTKLVVPSGDLPENERPGYVAPRSSYSTTGGYSWSSGSMSGSVSSRSYGYGAQSAGNRYYAGNCTWYAYERRMQLGRPIGGMWGNATSWASSARSAGYEVNKTPAPGAVIQTSYGGGGYGHVGVVERVDGESMLISDMNYAGYNVVTWRTIPMSQAGSYWFIH